MALETAQRDPNYVTTIMGVSLGLPHVPTQIYVDETTHRLLVSASISSISLPSVPVNGQQTVTSSAVALPSATLAQGVLIESLSTNTVSVFVGGASVTISGSTGGYELQPGATVSAAVSNTSALYVVCASTSPIITWLGS